MEKNIYESILKIITKIDYKGIDCILCIFFLSSILCCLFKIVPEEYQKWCLPALIFSFLSCLIHRILIYIPSRKAEQEQAKTFHLNFEEQNCWLKSTQQNDSTWNTQIHISFQAMNSTDNPIKLNFGKIIKPQIGEVTNHRLLIKYLQSTLYGTYDIYPKSTQPGILEIFVNDKYKMKNRKVHMELIISDSAGNVQAVSLYLRNDNDFEIE